MAARYDLVVVGAGPAGEKGAAQAAYHKKRVAIVESRPNPGGIAVSTAGVPTKALRESAIHLSGLGQRAQDLPLGWLGDGPLFERLMARKSELTDLMTQAVRRNLIRHQIELIQGRARLRADRSIEVGRPDGSIETLEADVVLLATGSYPVWPEAIPKGDPGIVDSDAILALPRLPEQLAVVGGGAVGCEYASIAATLGCRVTIIAKGERLLESQDVEVSRVLAESFNGAGIRIVSGSRVARAERTGERRQRLILENGKSIETEIVLISAGRRANTAGLGLGDAGVALTPRGDVWVDARFETTRKGVYAAGDVIGAPGLAATSMEQARVAICHAFGIELKQAVDPLCPVYVFSIPEVASVGLSEEAAKAQGIECEVGRASFYANTKARISGLADGMIKLVFRRQDRVVIGVHIVGEMASEIIHVGQFLMHSGGTIDRLIHATFAVPTRCEAYKYAAYDGLTRIERRATLR